MVIKVEKRTEKKERTRQSVWERKELSEVEEKGNV